MECRKNFFGGSNGVSSQKRYSPGSLGGARPSKGMVGSWKTTRSFKDGHFSGGIMLIFDILGEDSWFILVLLNKEPSIFRKKNTTNVHNFCQHVCLHLFLCHRYHISNSYQRLNNTTTKLGLCLDRNNLVPRKYIVEFLWVINSHHICLRVREAMCKEEVKSMVGHFGYTHDAPYLISG